MTHARNGGMVADAERRYRDLLVASPKMTECLLRLASMRAERRDFDAALRAARNALSGDLSRAPRRWTSKERALHEAHRSAQQTFAATLLDDANLPEALQALLDLATRLRQYCLEAATCVEINQCVGCTWPGSVER